MEVLRKIIALLLILLTSNIAGLHFYISEHHHHDNHCLVSHDQNKHDNDSPDEEPCQLCLLTFNLSHLDFYSSNHISFEANNIDISIIKKEISESSNIFYKHYFSKANRNKAPPALV